MFKLSADEAAEALGRWTAWRGDPASNSSSGSRAGSCATGLASIEHGLSNGLIESVNTKMRLITRMAFGFANADSSPSPCSNLGGHRPPLPGRT